MIGVSVTICLDMGCLARENQGEVAIVSVESSGLVVFCEVHGCALGGSNREAKQWRPRKLSKDHVRFRTV